jgi:hypothetical protein
MIRVVVARAILGKAIPTRAIRAWATLIRAILVKENQTKAAAKAAAKAVIPAVARVVKAAARAVDFDGCPLSRRGRA